MGGMHNYDSSAISLVTMTPCQTSAAYQALQMASDSDEQSFSTTADGFGARHTLCRAIGAYTNQEWHLWQWWW